MINRIEQETINIPSNFHNGYWYLPLPVAQSFISSSKTPTAIKRKNMQKLLDRAEHLISRKPKSHLRLRVVVAIDSPSLWNSQIIVFFPETAILRAFLIEMTTTKSGYHSQRKETL